MGQRTCFVSSLRPRGWRVRWLRRMTGALPPLLLVREDMRIFVVSFFGPTLFSFRFFARLEVARATHRGFSLPPSEQRPCTLCSQLRNQRCCRLFLLTLYSCSN